MKAIKRILDSLSLFACRHVIFYTALVWCFAMMAGIFFAAGFAGILAHETGELR
jgi:hypothetical protein